jgi:lactococcin 972 family bacteriocin
VKKSQKTIFSAVLAAALTVGGATAAANATTAYSPEGGTWNYGVRSGGIYGTVGEVYSEYYHPSRTHKSTACANGTCSYSGWVSAGTTSVAKRMQQSPNTAYYDVL